MKAERKTEWLSRKTSRSVCAWYMRVEFSTGYRIDATKWDNEKQRVKNGCTNKLKQTASEINADLLQYYTDVQTIFKQFKVKGTTPTPATTNPKQRKFRKFPKSILS